LGLSPDQIESKTPEIEAFAGIGTMIHHPVKTYSSGMYVRLAFAVAIATDPDILIVDEALAVGDESFQRKCFTRIRDIQERGGTILFVSHSDATIIELCNKAILLDKGELLCSGDPKAVISNYHKLLYAPDDKKESIRADLKTGVLFSDPCKTKKTDKTNDTSNNDADQHHFDDQLTPETMVSYESNGAQIRDPHITNMDGKRTNLLHPNETYLYKYTVTFINDAKSVKFGMMIKSKSGIPLAGSTTHSDGQEIQNVKAGTEVEVEFKFKNLLNRGTYFTNAGCSALINGERISIHRILDAFMFKVIPATNDTSRGIVNFNIEPRCELHQNDASVIEETILAK
ncbi:MAG: Wzt carbohydrate-binding domain-containing protein, partial [Rickettsiales bacterium]|nr:Wzt carbohydrate-binding domain-containing protein [Rickettsiales bacterium]